MIFSPIYETGSQFILAMQTFQSLVLPVLRLCELKMKDMFGDRNRIVDIFIV